MKKLLIIAAFLAAGSAQADAWKVFENSTAYSPGARVSSGVTGSGKYGVIIGCSKDAATDTVCMAVGEKLGTTSPTYLWKFLSDGTVVQGGAVTYTAGAGLPVNYYRIFTDATTETGLGVSCTARDTTSSVDGQHCLAVWNVASTAAVDSLFMAGNRALGGNVVYGLLFRTRENGQALGTITTEIGVEKTIGGVAGRSLDIAGGDGGTANLNSDGAAGGAVNITAGVGTVLHGTGTNDGSGGVTTLKGGARGGATGTAVQGYVAVGAPTVGSTKTVDLLAVAGGLEVDGVARFDGGVTSASVNNVAAGTLSLGTATTTSVTIGSASVTALTVTTDGTGDGEVVLPVGSVSAGEILDLTRSIPLPFDSWNDCTTPAVLTFNNNTADTLPTKRIGTATAGVEYDAVGGSVDTAEICTTFVVPQDYASGGSFAARLTQGGATVTNIETFSCRISVDGAAVGAANAGNNVNQTAAQSVTSTPAGTWAAGAAIAVSCKQGNGSADDLVIFGGIEGRYTASE